MFVRPSNTRNSKHNVKHQRHVGGNIDEVVEDEIEYSEEDIIEAEFEEIEITEDKKEEWKVFRFPIG